MRSTLRMVFLCLVSLPVLAANPGAALDASWTTVCANATAGSAFADRCAEILNAGPGSGDRRSAAASGNNLGNQGAQGRVANLERGDQAADFSTEDLDFEASFGRWSLHINGSTSNVERDSSPFESGFESDATSFSAGLDYRLENDWSLGILAEFNRTDTDFAGGVGEQETDGLSVYGLLSGQLSDKVYLAAYAGSGQLDYDTTRNISYSLVLNAGQPNQSNVTINSIAEGSTDADQQLFGVEVGYGIHQGAVSWNLSLGYDYVNTEVDSYSETGGGGLAQRFDDQDITSQRWTAGISWHYTASRDWGILMPHARLRWHAETDDDARNLVSSFVGDATNTAIVYETEDPDSSFGTIAVGFSTLVPGGTSFFLEYQRDFAHDFLEEWVISAGVRFEL